MEQMTDNAADVADFLDTDNAERTDFVRWNGNPAVLLPDGSKRVAHGRPSSQEKKLSDTTALDKWKHRTIIEGISNDPSIVPAYIAATTKKEKNELADRALNRGGSDDAADWGTALHKLTEQIDAGERSVDDLPEREAQRMREYLDALDVFGLEVCPDWIEVQLVNDKLRFAGTADRIFKATKQIVTPWGENIRPGDYIGADLKTNSGDLKWSLLTYEVQSAIYFGRDALFYNVVTDERTPLPEGMRHDWSLMVHLPSAGEGCDMIFMDMERGQRGADLAREVSNWRKEKVVINVAAAPIIANETTVEPVEVEAETATVTDPMTDAVPTDETLQWIKDRVAAVRAKDKRAVNLLVDNWPPGVPGLKATGHTAAQLGLIDKAVSYVEKEHSMPFIPAPEKPREPRESSVIPTPERREYVPESTQDNDADPLAVQVLRDRVAALTEPQRAWVTDVVRQTGSTFKLTAPCSVVTFERVVALVTWAEISHVAALDAALNMLARTDITELATFDSGLARTLTSLGQDFAEDLIVLDGTGTDLVRR